MGTAGFEASRILPTWRPLSLTLSPEGRGDHLWEHRPRGDAALDDSRTIDSGEATAPTNTPSPSQGEGGGEGGHPLLRCGAAPTKTPSPSQGEGWGEGERARLRCHVACSRHGVGQ